MGLGAGGRGDLGDKGWGGGQEAGGPGCQEACRGADPMPPVSRASGRGGGELSLRCVVLAGAPLGSDGTGVRNGPAFAVRTDKQSACCLFLPRPPALLLRVGGAICDVMKEALHLPGTASPAGRLLDRGSWGGHLGGASDLKPLSWARGRPGPGAREGVLGRRGPLVVWRPWALGGGVRP